MKYVLFLYLFSLLIFFSCESNNEPVHVPVFTNGQEGFACYRISAVIKAPNGDIHAFSDARKHSCADSGDVNIVLKRCQEVLMQVVYMMRQEGGFSIPVLVFIG